MTVVQLVEQILRDNWTESVSGRPNNVPQPSIIRGQSDSRARLRTDDIAQVLDGGDTEYEPKSLGWTEEGQIARVTVRLKTATRTIDDNAVADNGRLRMFGELGAGSLTQYETGRWSGLVGETLRIIRDNRKGLAQYHRVLTPTVRDTSNLEGVNVYRADVDIRLEVIATNIDTTV